MIYKNPLAIWFWTTEQFSSQVCLVNDRYRYEIFDRVTGKRVAMEHFPTLAQAKDEVLILTTGEFV
jgi:hypothetical protein